MKPTDHEMVKAVFAISAFNPEPWLKSLANEHLKKYTAFLNTHKHKDTVLVGTVGNIVELKKLEDSQVISKFICNLECLVGALGVFGWGTWSGLVGALAMGKPCFRWCF